MHYPVDATHSNSSRLMLIEKVLLPAAAMTLGSIFSRVMCDHGGKFASWVQEQSEDPQHIIEKASEQYAWNYAKRHGVLKVLGMREPVSLESVYTPVQFLDRDSLSRFDSIEELEKAFREQGERSFQRKQSRQQDGLKVANEKQYLMVLGGPGAGKSTFLRKMGLETLKGLGGGYAHECIPVLIELKNFTSDGMRIAAAIAQEFAICGIPSPEAVTTRLLEDGKLLLLLDGLDEVPTKNVDAAIRQIQNFVDQYDKNRFIASCRIAAYRNSFRRFSDVAMADFNQEQIKQFILNWFYSDADLEAGTALKCWNLLQKSENRAARELAQSPLLLTLLCLVYHGSQNFPQNRSVLYRKALRVLLEEWAAEKRIFPDEIYQGLSTELEEVLLSEIAYQGFEANRLFFSQREVVDQIKTFLADNLNAPKHLNGEKVLEAIAIQQGILVERAQDVFSFSHLTLQEYLTAQYIDDHQQVQALVQQHLIHERWQEVFLLVAGLMRGGADHLLTAMEAQAKTLINTPKLRALLTWTDEITQDSAGSLNPAAKRATALFLALVSDRALHLARVLEPGLARTLELARTLSHTCTPKFLYDSDSQPTHAAVPTRALAIALTQSLPSRSMGKALAKTFTQTFTDELARLQAFPDYTLDVLVARLKDLKKQAPDFRQHATVHQEFHSRIYQTWCHSLKLDPTWISLSKEEIRKLDRYLYANWLIVRCKQAAVRVSSLTWQRIEERMLRV
ncbi:NACHT domain-containing protein [Leptodesmis sichuanensis]|uniref:NACHT domain-containing protein n=1 Tax=Leptodesmis sichuanensis TaxID=2906798 RepID=UPI001F2D2031|nr:NACHT domain-containing protein [Leptodesmis sichuanensis]